ncbi:sensor histidine kinase [Paenibacillus validus]|uniref:histidine kinase n=1 Tax=Paenibacillus validus TaxID=44253 RepID=A0A7X3CU19_9BACL|nr:ATP-binding protein [Paenibacillus validus]MUG73435.1 HAMP domain-containing protein [Paenibacillus validus]
MSKSLKVKKPRKPMLERFPFTWFPFTLLRAFIYFIIDMYHLARNHVERSVRLQLVLTFSACFGAALLFYGVSSALFGQINKGTVIDYTMGIERIDNEARNLVRILEPPSYEDEIVAEEPVAPSEVAVERIPEPGIVQHHATEPGSPGHPPDTQMEDDPNKRRQDDYENRLRSFTSNVKRLAANEKFKIVVTDLYGKVVFRSENAPEMYVDVHSVIRNAMDTRNDFRDSRTEFSSFYPVTYNNQKSYLVVTGIPQPHISYVKGQSPISMLSALGVFIFLFYFMTQRKMRYLEELAGGLRIISTGNLDHRVVERSRDELGSLARDMNQMVSELQLKMEEERRAERLKNELVTNVSHDLRTPLTLIMGYLRLLHDKNYESPEQAAGYVSIAYSKAEKLKGLIDDLFEYTKLSNQDVPLHKRGVVLNEVLEQLLEEYVTLSEEEKLTLIRSIPQDKLIVQVDVDKIIRVFDNLLSNAIKYSPKPGVISVGLAQDKQHAVVRISNKADALTREELELLFDRFYRIDPARGSTTGGSGLGLAIAKSIVESHNGQIWAESDDGDIHFYVKLKLVS